MAKTEGSDNANIPGADEQSWLDAVDRVLKGKAFDTLISQEIGGLERNPLYTETHTQTNHDPAGLPGAWPYMRGAKAVNDRFLPWQIVSRVIPSRKNADAEDVLTDLQGGVSTLLLDLSQTSTPTSAQLKTLLADVQLDIAPLMLRAGQEAQAHLDLFFELLAEKQAHQANAYADFDPLGTAAAQSKPADFTPLTQLIEQQKNFPNTRLMTASGMAYHNSGADAITELAYTIATYVAYVKALIDNGLSAQEAFSTTTITLATDTDFFANIAKIRAARALWSQLAQAYGITENLTPQIHAEGSEHHYSVADPWVNILRATIATLGAGIGGADFVSVAPCTAVSSGDNRLTRRVARNTQIILQEESHIGRVTDPAGGSWYIEQLSQDLAQKAWRMFQQIEADGGMEAALTQGKIAAHIETLRTETALATAHRKLPLLGVTEFPNLGEAPLEPRPAFGNGALAEHRPAAIYEKLRLTALPVKPKIFLATLGTQAQFTARANFAANLFAAGGIDALTGNGGEELKHIAQEFLESGAKIVAICGTDEAYDAHAQELAQYLYNAGASHVWIAGKMEIENVDALYAGCNALSILQTAHHVLGLEA